MSSRSLQFALLILNLASLSFCWQEGEYYACEFFHLFISLRVIHVYASYFLLHVLIK